MKCPKCGSENVATERRPNGFNTCLKCGYRWQNGAKQPELTTAEMLLWLVNYIESRNMYIQFGHGTIEIKTPLKGMEILCETTEIKYGHGEVFTTLYEAIRAAYTEAKKQEVTE